MACSTPPDRDSLLRQAPGPGISHDLAVARASVISSLDYDLRFDLTKLAAHIPASAELAFDLAPAAERLDLVLDFAGEDLELVRANDDLAPSRPSRSHDHWVLPASNLRPGRNRLAFRFTAPLAAAGAPLIHYHDAENRQDFVYTLLVPSDAHRLFPCFDQPDLRGRFRVLLDLPAGWSRVANVDSGFTVPLPTYLFAFAAGPFHKVEQPGLPRVFVRPSRAKELDDTVAKMNQRALEWLEEWFGTEYAFGKLDVVLLPAFPYGGMEHAGAIFYRENALIFDHVPTPSELHRRSTLIYHEVAHQWFGNLVTMRWFDDLWLKEGFATFVGYRALEALEPQAKPWLRFLQSVKPPAYAVDATPGTSAIWQELGNLDDAKSNYGPIVYNKAPAVLRELEARLGETAFRRGVRDFLKRHALDAARWDDLVGALAAASGQDLRRWSQRWILSGGMPCVSATVNTSGGKVTSALLQQSSTLADGGVWPLHVDLLIGYPDGTRLELTSSLDSESAPVPALPGTTAPTFVVANHKDVAYGTFLLDAASAKWWLEHLPSEPDELLRAVVCRQLHDGVRAKAIDPSAFAACLLELLPRESDAETHANLLATLGTMLLRYQPADRRARQLASLTDHALAILESGPEPKRLSTFRFLARTTGDPRVLAFAARVARGDVPFATGLQDRFLAYAALIAAQATTPELEKLLAGIPADEARRLRYLATTATPDAGTKDRYFADYGRVDAPPEQWAQDSLPFFHWQGQESWTLPFLRRALEQVDWIKKNRKIFFLGAWIDAFVNGHSSTDALRIVDSFLADRGVSLETDVRKKLLQSRDELARAVAIRSRWTSRN